MPEEQEKKENFQYIVRIANKDLKGERNTVLALADLKGVGIRLAKAIANKLELDSTKKLGELTEEEVEVIRDFVESEEYENFPHWLLNNRNDPVTGRNVNLVSNDLDIQIQDNVNLMRRIRSYKGIRHETGHKVRGQRTRSNGRKGLTMGVQRKKE
ncbi:MAG: 30S ribosomal protein S13 [Thermoplasmataceae archaeon]|uniref:Ribosomal protein S13, archaeal n=1 Tax=mine drainage metagenome TaxID=410659 RepID=T0XZB4_9ZZZZ